MKIKDLADKLNLKVLTPYDEDKNVTGCYSGDLLSWVMSRAKEGDVWLTVMGNVNAVAVAVLIIMAFRKHDRANLFVNRVAAMEAAAAEEAEEAEEVYEAEEAEEAEAEMEAEAAAEAEETEEPEAEAEDEAVFEDSEE